MVIERLGDRLLVENNSSRAVTLCRQDSKLRGSVIVVGDNVCYETAEPESNGNLGTVTGAAERRNLLYRADAVTRRQGGDGMKAIASNIDQLVIVVAVQPLFHITALDHLLAAAEAYNMQPLIVLNKWDIPESKTLYERIEFYSSELSYPIIRLSTATSYGLEELYSVLRHKTSIFVGASGVG